MTNMPWLRQVEVVVGPLPEWQGQGNSKQALKIVGDGSIDKLRIKFNVHKQAPTTGTPSTVEIYNLNQDTRNRLSKQPYMSVALRAGWQNTGLVLVFTGGFTGVTHRREGTDIITSLISLPGWSNLSRAVVAKTFQGGSTLKSVVFDLARQIPSIVVDANLIVVKNMAVGSQGLSFAGLVEQHLNNLSRAYGFTWWIDNGVFHAQDDYTTPAGNAVKISYKNGFLLRAEPILVAPQQIQTGVTIQALFLPAVVPYSIIALESKINEKLNRNYKVFIVDHSGDTHSSQWTTSITTWPTLGAGGSSL